MWYQEKIDKHAHYANPKFQLCCGNGKIQFPLLNDPPIVMQKLLFESNSIEFRNFQQHIRTYNMMFAFTSLLGLWQVYQVAQVVTGKFGISFPKRLVYTN